MDILNTITPRIKLAISYLITKGKALNQEDLGRKIGINSKSYLSQLINCKANSIILINKLSEFEPDLNADWLLTGEGSMLRSEESPSRHAETTSAPGPKSVPYYNVDFAAGFPEVENDQTSVPSGTVTMPGFSEADCLVNVTGGSMEPLINSGDAVALRRISSPESILYGEVYAIVTDEYRTIKRVRRSDVPGHIRLVPENPDYDPQDIEVGRIRHIYKVLGAVKLF